MVTPTQVKATTEDFQAIRARIEDAMDAALLDADPADLNSGGIVLREDEVFRNLELSDRQKIRRLRTKIVLYYRTQWDVQVQNDDTQGFRYIFNEKAP